MNATKEHADQSMLPNRILGCLIELVSLSRSYRADEFDKRLLLDAQNNLEEDLEALETELTYARAGFRLKFKDFATEEDLLGEILDLKAGMKKNDRTLGQIWKNSNGIRSYIRKWMQHLYAAVEVQGQSTFSSLPFCLSPLFLRKLRLSRVEALVLNDLIDRAADAALSGSIAAVNIRKAAKTVQQHIDSFDITSAESVAALRASLFPLHQAMRSCQDQTQRFEQLDMRARTRGRRQCSAEVSLILNYVAPILEAERLMERDKFRTSVVDEVRPGEPLIFPNPPMELTPSDAGELDQDLGRAADELRLYEDLLRYVHTHYDRDLHEYTLAHPDKKASEFRRKHLAFKRRTKCALEQAKERKAKVLQRGKKYNHWSRHYDFLHDKRDDKHAQPRTAEQLELKAKTKISAEKEDSVERWIEPPAHIYGDGDVQNLGSAGERKSLELHIQSVPTSELQRGLDSTFDLKSEEVRQTLLRKYKAEQEAMREALLDSDDESAESVRCCC